MHKNILYSTEMHIVKTSWSAQEYAETLQKYPRCSGQNSKTETLMDCLFPPIYDTKTKVSEACIFVDSQEAIIAWYLPNLLLPERQVHLSGNASFFRYWWHL